MVFLAFVLNSYTVSCAVSCATLAGQFVHVCIGYHYKLKRTTFISIGSPATLIIYSWVEIHTLSPPPGKIKNEPVQLKLSYIKSNTHSTYPLSCSCQSKWETTSIFSKWKKIVWQMEDVPSSSSQGGCLFKPNRGLAQLF